MSARLGKRQERVLAALRRQPSNSWRPGCGWSYGTDSETDEILASLVRRGLVVRTGTYGLYGEYRLASSEGSDERCVSCGEPETDPEGPCRICYRCSLCCDCGTFDR